MYEITVFYNHDGNEEVFSCLEVGAEGSFMTLYDCYQGGEFIAARLILSAHHFVTVWVEEK